jgi:23S rRNA (cytosine1962-C5)-methyltransferase
MILHRDDDWLAVDKPTGLSTHAPRAGVLGAVEWLRLHLGEETHVVSRLDAGTSGVLLLARHAAAAARAQEVHEAGAARKTYEFLSDGDGPPDGFVCEDPLDDRPARTEFTRVAGRRWRAVITAGRRHQIRRHAAAHGLPLLGDAAYGGTPWPRLALHCSEVAWPGLEPVRSAPPASFDADDDRAWAVACERRGNWPRQVSDAWRAVHRDEVDGLPVAVDVYGPWFNAVWFDEDVAAAAALERLDPLLHRVAAHAGCRGGVVRTHRRNPHGKGLVGETTPWGEPPSGVFTVTEHGLHYAIDLLATQHTGLFLDQRDTRRRLALAAAGARVANLFAFTCSFSVAAAAAGAEVVFSVDTAKACLETGKANFAANALAETGRGKFVQEDARKWLGRQERRRDERPADFTPLDLVVCDPPVFAAGKGGARFSVEEEWPRLARSGAGLLAPDGQALFANNHRGGNHARYRAQLADAFAVVEDLRAPLDFPEIGENAGHVRVFWCR